MDEISNRERVISVSPMNQLIRKLESITEGRYRKYFTEQKVPTYSMLLGQNGSKDIEDIAL